MRVSYAAIAGVALLGLGISSAQAGFNPTVIDTNGNVLAPSSSQVFSASDLTALYAVATDDPSRDKTLPVDPPLTEAATKYTFSDGTVLWGDQDPFLSFNYSVTNSTLLTQTFTTTFTLPILTLVSPTTMAGSIGTTLTSDGMDGAGNPAPAVVTAGPGTFLYTAKLNGATAIQLIPNGSTFSVVDPFDTETAASVPGSTNPGVVGQTSVGLPGVTLPGGAANSPMTVTLNFTLTAGDSIGFTGAFVVNGSTGNVPEPASLAVLALGAVGLLKRRR